MAQITAASVKQLRDTTLAGMADCKKALEETGGDMEKAAASLREKGLSTAVKKASREANEGRIEIYAHQGGRMAVSELYGHIQKDVRHKDVVLLHYEEIAERRFGGWTMGQVNMSRINVSILLKYAEKPELDPYAVSGKVSLALLEELMATASIMGRA